MAAQTLPLVVAVVASLTLAWLGWACPRQDRRNFS